MDILLAILPMVLGFLGQLFVAFLQNWNATHGNDPNLASIVYSYVQSAQANPTLITDDDKYQWVVDRMKEWAMVEGKLIKDSMLNTLIELAVQRLKAVNA